MLEWLDDKQVAELEAKRPNLKAKLEEYRDDGIRLDLWKMDTWTAGKRPLLLLARMTYSSLPGKADYRLIMSQPGKQGTVCTWECPPVMPGAEAPVGKHPGGRPVEYGVEAAKQVQEWRQEGYSIRQIAKMGGCSTFTVQKLMRMTE